MELELQSWTRHSIKAVRSGDYQPELYVVGIEQEGEGEVEIAQGKTFVESMNNAKSKLAEIIKEIEERIKEANV